MPASSSFPAITPRRESRARDSRVFEPRMALASCPRDLSTSPFSRSLPPSLVAACTSSDVRRPGESSCGGRAASGCGACQPLSLPVPMPPERLAPPAAGASTAALLALHDISDTEFAFNPAFSTPTDCFSLVPTAGPAAATEAVASRTSCGPASFAFCSLALYLPSGTAARP